jgi:hypothetical protein
VVVISAGRRRLGCRRTARTGSHDHVAATAGSGTHAMATRFGLRRQTSRIAGVAPPLQSPTRKRGGALRRLDAGLTSMCPCMRKPGSRAGARSGRWPREERHAHRKSSNALTARRRRPCIRACPVRRGRSRSVWWPLPSSLEKSLRDRCAHLPRQ